MGVRDQLTLAQYLCAAALTWGLGNKSIDYQLKWVRSESPDVGDYWNHLAVEVMEAMAKSRTRPPDLDDDPGGYLRVVK